MKEQMNQGVSREFCEQIVKNYHPSERAHQIARAHLLLVDECENLRRQLDDYQDMQEEYASLRKDKERLDWLLNMNDLDLMFIKWPGKLILNTREDIDAAISENAAKAPKAVSKESLPTEIGHAESTARYEAGDLPLASSKVDREQDSSVSGAGQ